MAQAKLNATPISEPCPVIDAFATELAAIETLGPCLRLTFTVQQTGYDETQERTAIAKVVMSAEAVQQMLIDLPLLMRNLPEKRRPEVPAHLN